MGEYRIAKPFINRFSKFGKIKFIDGTSSGRLEQFPKTKAVTSA